jgi:spermidine/putrescine transport system substrate-binding protein
VADDPIKILAPPKAAHRLGTDLTRRRLLGIGATGLAGLVVGPGLLAACGGDDSGSAGGTGASGTGGGGKGNHKLNLFTWAEYHAQDNLDRFGNVTVTVYNSNEEAIAKLQASKGTSGFDVIIPTGAYIPQMAADDLIIPLDQTKLTNVGNLDPIYLNQTWDPGNKYTIPKDWGTTGWIYDNSVITTPLKTWNDFLDAATGPASGQTSVLDAAPDLTGIYFWANGIDWTTTDTKDLDACENYIVNTLAPHVKAFDSYPGINLTQGNYVLSQVWNGDARQGLLAVDDPSKYTWGLGGPTTELWMDNYAIVKDAPNLDSAYAFIDFMLVPDNSVIDLEFHGYNTGLKDIESLLPADLQFKDLIFFTPEEVKTMQAGAVNEAQDRLVDIYNKAKAKAGA